MSHHLVTCLASQLHDLASFSELLDFRFVYIQWHMDSKQTVLISVTLYNQLQLTYVASLI